MGIEPDGQIQILAKVAARTRIDNTKHGVGAKKLATRLNIAEKAVDHLIDGAIAANSNDGVGTIAQGLWGSESAKTQTIPNLLREMDAMRVQHAMLLPIKLGLPFGDQLFEDWYAAVNTAQAEQRLHVGFSTHPHANDAIEKMRQGATRGGRVIKLHPTVQRFYPD